MSKKSIQNRIQNLLNHWKNAPTMHEAAKYAAKAWVFLQELNEMNRESRRPTVDNLWEDTPTKREVIALPDTYTGALGSSKPVQPDGIITSTLKGAPAFSHPSLATAPTVKARILPSAHSAVTKPAFTLWDNDPEDEWDR